jgi:hypothetical protein
MSIPISFYPDIDDKLINKIGIENGEFRFSYTRNKEVFMVTKYSNESRMKELIYFEDPNYEWEPNQCNLKIKKSVVVKNPIFLFGPRGVAPKGALLAVGVIWTCKAINLRGAKEIHVFEKNHLTPIQCDIELNFLKGTLKNELNIKTIIYIKSSGNPQLGEEMLGNEAGLILGTISQSSVVIEGNGSVFPIVEVNEPGMPLWWVYCSWTDPQEDSFDEEHVKLCLNRAHGYYSDIYNNKSVKNSPLFIEIMASALQTIIYKVERSEYWENIKRNYNNSPGSIGEAVYYFMSTFDWDFSSPESLSRTIRQYLEENI